MYAELGTESRTGKKVSMTIPNYGNILFAAQPGAGKTSLVKCICAQIAKYRKLIIFDVMNCEYQSISLPNFLSKRSMCVENMITLDAVHFGFNPIQLDHRDFMAMEFSPRAAQAAMNIIQQFNGDPAFLREVFQDLPVNDGEFAEFQSKYPDIKIDSTIHEKSKQNLVQCYTQLYESGFFTTQKEHDLYMDTNGEKGRAYMSYDFLKGILRKHHIRFNFDLTTGDETLAQFYVGKIMQLLREVQTCATRQPKEQKFWCRACKQGIGCYKSTRNLVEIFHPLLIVEEADMLFKNLDFGIKNYLLPISLQEGIFYINKLRRFGCSMLTICQEPKNLHVAFKMFNRAEIIGRVAHAHPMAMSLHFDPMRGIFEFLYIDTSNPTWASVFRPIPLAVYDVKRNTTVQGKFPAYFKQRIPKFNFTTSEYMKKLSGG